MTALWEEVKLQIQQQISQPSYETWIRHTTAELNDDTLTINAMNAFACDWLANHYGQLIDDIVKKIAGQSYKLLFVSQENKDITAPSKTYDTISKQSLFSLVQQQNQTIEKLEQQVADLELRIQNLENQK